MDFSWLWIVPVLGFLVLVHEAGHFFTARMFGIRVEEFGLGLPPRAFAIHRGGVDYSINWLPIGGFVKILGENGDSDAPDSFGKAAPWKRIVVLAAGVTMNLITALLIFFVLGVLGQTVVSGPPLISGINDTAGSAATAGIVKNDLVLAIDGQPMASLDAMKRYLETRRGQDTVFTIDRGGKIQQIHATPNPDKAGLALGVGLSQQAGPMLVQKVEAGSQAAQNGLQVGDVLVSVNGQYVSSLDRLNAALTAAKGQPTVALSYVRPASGQAASAAFVQAVSGTPPAPIQVALGSGGLVGVKPVPPSSHFSYGPAEAVGYAFGTTWDLLKAIPESLGQVFTGKAEANSFAGPIGIAQITGEVSRESGLQGLLRLMAILGINLALINILPLPALDGGRILFIIINGILGVLPGKRTIGPEREGLVHLVGMGLLLLLILLISIGDVTRLITGSGFLPK